MAELLLLLPEYMAALIDHARRDADGRKEKLLRRSWSFLMLSSCRKCSSLDKQV